MKKIQALHLFDSYLPVTENWIYSHLERLPVADIHVAANQIYSNKFKNENFSYFPNNKTYQGITGKILRKINAWTGNDFQSKIVNYAKQQRIDLVHAHFGNIAWQYRKVAEQLDGPFLISFYGMDYEKIPHLYPAYVERYKKLFSLADGFICEGNNGAQLLLDKGCPQHKIHVNHLGIDIDQIPFFQRTKTPNALRLVQIATLTAKKGHLSTLVAFRKAHEQFPGIELTLVGRSKDAALKAAIDQYIAKHDLSKAVTLIEEIDYARLHEFMKDFDVFIHPSQYTKDMDCEGGAPIVLLDAQATGMPVISTRHCDIPDEVLHKSTGLLVDEKDVKALSNAIFEFYKMGKEEYAQYAKRSRYHVANNYNLDQTAMGLRKIYERYLT